MPAKNTEAKFWAHMTPEPNTGCWLWTGATHHAGHGTVSFGGRYWQTHRLAWTLVNGSIPGGAFLCHRCNVSGCCNPAHLYVGDARSNYADARTSDRHTRGERIGISKLTDEDVGEIRSTYRFRDKSGRDARGLAVKYGVHHETIYKALRGATWSHVR